jgi:hypothetical protein
MNRFIHLLGGTMIASLALLTSGMASSDPLPAKSDEATAAKAVVKPIIKLNSRHRTRHAHWKKNHNRLGHKAKLSPAPVAASGPVNPYLSDAPWPIKPSPNPYLNTVFIRVASASNPYVPSANPMHSVAVVPAAPAIVVAKAPEPVAVPVLPAAPVVAVAAAAAVAEAIAPAAAKISLPPPVAAQAAEPAVVAPVAKIAPVMPTPPKPVAAANNAYLFNSFANLQSFIPGNPISGISNAFSGLKSLLPAMPSLADESILPTIKKVFPTGEKPLYVLTFKCPTELIGIVPAPTKLLHWLVTSGMDAINSSDLLPFNMQQVCQ